MLNDPRKHHYIYISPLLLCVIRSLNIKYTCKESIGRLASYSRSANILTSKDIESGRDKNNCTKMTLAFERYQIQYSCNIYFKAFIIALPMKIARKNSTRTHIRALLMYPIQVEVHLQSSLAGLSVEQTPLSLDKILQFFHY